MTQRNPITVAVLSLLTCGIYFIVWLVQTKTEMKGHGADIPTAWLLIIPFVNYWWFWKYSEGVERETGGQLSTVLSFVVLVLIAPVGAAIVQDSFNKAAAGATPVPPPPPPPPA